MDEQKHQQEAWTHSHVAQPAVQILVDAVAQPIVVVQLVAVAQPVAVAQLVSAAQHDIAAALPTAALQHIVALLVAADVAAAVQAAVAAIAALLRVLVAFLPLQQYSADPALQKPVVADSGPKTGFPLLLQQLQQAAGHSRGATVDQGSPKTTVPRGPGSAQVGLLRYFDNSLATDCLGFEGSADLVVDNSAGLLEFGADFLGAGSFADCPHS